MEDVIRASHIFIPAVAPFRQTATCALPTNPGRHWTHMALKVYDAEGQPLQEYLNMRIGVCIRSSLGLFPDMVLLDRPVPQNQTSWIPLRWPVPTNPFHHHILTMELMTDDPSFQGFVRFRALSVEGLVDESVKDHVYVDALGGAHIRIVSRQGEANDVYNLAEYAGHQVPAEEAEMVRVVHTEWIM